MTDFFRNETSNNVNIQACADKIKSLIDNKQVIILNNFIYTNFGLKKVIETWQEENEIKASINVNEVINKYTKAVEKMYC